MEIGWTPSEDRIYLDNAHLTLWHADERVEATTPSGSRGVLTMRPDAGYWMLESPPSQAGLWCMVVGASRQDCL